MEEPAIAAVKKHRLNEEITAAEVRLVGVDGEQVGIVSIQEAIAALKSGDLLATSAFDAMKIACAATMAAVRLSNGEAVPRSIELPVEIVTAENCAAWDKGYEERPLPSWEDVVAA